MAEGTTADPLALERTFEGQKGFQLADTVEGDAHWREWCELRHEAGEFKMCCVPLTGRFVREGAAEGRKLWRP